MVQYLQNVSGRVIELCSPYKAIVSIDPSIGIGAGQRALLWSNKLTIDGKFSLLNEIISKYVSINSKVTFTCHSLDDKLQDNCPWFIATARRQHPGDMVMGDNFHFGIMHGFGYPIELSPRQGVLEHTTPTGKTIHVLFQASKVFIHGKRIKSKQTLEDVMHSDSYAFDAIPINPYENNYHCPWFATIVWKGTKPPCNYDEVSTSEIGTSGTKVPSLYAEIKTLAYDPRGLFWRGYGIIGKIFDDEFCLIYGRRQPNRYESIIFHRNFLTLFKNRMANKDLRKFLKPGLRVQFVAVSASEKFLVQWIGSHVSIDEDGHTANDVNFMP